MKPPQNNSWLQTLTGTRVRVQTPGSETDNRLCIIEYIEPANTSPPVFTRHEFVEVFCMVSGSMQFQFKDEPKFLLEAGQSITCSSWKPHSFWNDTDIPAHALLVCSPAGLDQFFIESDELLQNNTADVAVQMNSLREKYGIQHVGEAPFQ